MGYELYPPAPLGEGTVNTTTILDETITSADINPATNISYLNPTGMVAPFAGFTAPDGWLLCDGTAVNRVTYADLFSALTNNKGSFTVTVATPGVFTLTSHGMVAGDTVYLTTTGALPTGLTANTLYYVTNVATNTFNLSTTLANALATTPVVIATSGTQSGTHNLTRCPYGVGDGSTTFNLPDLRGRVAAGRDNMGSAASRITKTYSGMPGSALGTAGGHEDIDSHNHGGVTGSQSATHYHNWRWSETSGGANDYNPLDTGVGGQGQTMFGVDTSTGVSATYTAITDNASANHTHTVSTEGTGTARNVQPTIILNYIIKT